MRRLLIYILKYSNCCVCTPTCSGETFILFFQAWDIVVHLKPSSSTGDVMPPHLFKQIFDCAGTTMLNLFNKCLSYGLCPADFKHATINPIVKEAQSCNRGIWILDPSQMYTVLEKVVLKQLQAYITFNSSWNLVLRPFSSETVLVKVLNVIFLALDNGEKCYPDPTWPTWVRHLMWWTIIF